MYKTRSIDLWNIGSTDELDFDKDLPNITGAKEGLGQSYNIEQTTNLWSFNTGRVQAKMGVNTPELPEKTPVSFVLLDNHHLSEHGVRYFCARSQQVVLITNNPKHPAFQVSEDNLHIIYGEALPDALVRLKNEYGCERLTVQSGGTINGMFLRKDTDTQGRFCVETSPRLPASSPLILFHTSPGLVVNIMLTLFGLLLAKNMVPKLNVLPKEK